MTTSTILLLTGVACLIAAIVGRGFKAFGIEIPVLESVQRQILLAILGIGLMTMSRFDLDPPRREVIASPTDGPTRLGGGEETNKFAAIPSENGGQSRPHGDDAARSQELTLAWRSFDALLSSVNSLHRQGVIRSGSPQAIALADALDRERASLNEATNAAKIDDDARYAAAIVKAEQAARDIRAELDNR